MCPLQSSQIPCAMSPVATISGGAVWLSLGKPPHGTPGCASSCAWTRTSDASPGWERFQCLGTGVGVSALAVRGELRSRWFAYFPASDIAYGPVPWQKVARQSARKLTTSGECADWPWWKILVLGTKHTNQFGTGYNS